MFVRSKVKFYSVPTLVAFTPNVLFDKFFNDKCSKTALRAVAYYESINLHGFALAQIITKVSFLVADIKL